MQTFTAQKILFDLDGTLVDTAADLHAATNHTLQSIGREPVTLSQVRHMVGHGALRLIELGLEATGGRQDVEPKELLGTFLAYYEANISVHSMVYEGGFEMLKSLNDDGFRMAVCTNKPYAMAVSLLSKIGLRPYFEAVTGGDTFSFRKPDGRHLLETSTLISGTGKTLMVGDSSPDINAARNAGMDVIAVNFGYADVPPEKLGADALIGSLADLPSILDFEDA